MPFFFIVSIVLYIFLCISTDSWTSQLPPECPIKLCLKHLGASIVCVSKLFQIPDKNQFQRLESHRIRFSYGNDPTSLVSRFFNFFLNVNCYNQTTQQKELTGIFILAQTFRGFQSSWQGRHCGRAQTVAVGACGRCCSYCRRSECVTGRSQGS